MTTKKSAAHTPGPWETVEHTLPGGTYYVVVQPWADRHDECHPIICQHVSERDARLIAAAPALLAALRAMLKKHPPSDPYCNCFQFGSPCSPECQSRAALAQATGTE